ncbi:Crp/Fnr family transcriptional regulator [Hymenobacter sp. BT559]|uniref:Crp/Fnr family transcriptional regulator n=1 Tax=Hymenobacter sp. BT559 TaxID=2795729 RepID=UPI0018EDE686|nr:Crp/Fnr family transcriptional regulator [Hymenobacter sp. BT559]MBJ6144148.1 Crp/Fnr family transcriptional regulator [Hymenobacter sp. BT559]
MQRFTKPECQACPHRQNPLLSCCSPEELASINSNKTTLHYQKGQYIYHEGSQAMGLFCINQGKIKLAKAAGDNKEQIVHLLREGGVMGYRALVAGSRYTHSAVALEDCVVCFMPRLDFLQLVQGNQQFAMGLMQLLAQTLGLAEERMLHLAYKPVRERLAGALLFVQQTFHREDEALPFRIALGREDLAALVGTAKETVSRLLSEFKDAGMIVTRGSQITILKPLRLQELATMYD